MLSQNLHPLIIIIPSTTSYPLLIIPKGWRYQWINKTLVQPLFYETNQSFSNQHKIQYLLWHFFMLIGYFFDANRSLWWMSCDLYVTSEALVILQQLHYNFTALASSIRVANIADHSRVYCCLTWNFGVRPCDPCWWHYNFMLFLYAPKSLLCSAIHMVLMLVRVHVHQQHADIYSAHTPRSLVPAV